MGHASRSIGGIPVYEMSTEEFDVNERGQIGVIAAHFPRRELVLGRVQKEYGTWWELCKAGRAYVGYDDW